MIKIMGCFLLLSLSIPLFSQSRVIRQGHRGCRGNMPENTIAAMKKALDLGVEVLELDVVISRDKKVVVSHDTYMSAQITLKPSGDTILPEEEKKLLLYNMDYSEIKKYDVGSRRNPAFPQQEHFPAYKPLLEELIDSADQYARLKGMPLPYYNIEIKSQPSEDGVEHPAPQEFARLVMDVCRSRKIVSRMNIQSFDVRPLQLLHEQYKKLPLSYLTETDKPVEENLADLGFIPAFYSPYYKTVTAALVKACHDKNIRIIPWTVNTRREIDTLVQLGVDGIITDYPGLF